MAVSIEAAFVLLDKASKPLKDIEKQARKTDAALRGMGTAGAGGGSFGSATSKLNSFSSALDEARKTSKALGDETDKTAKKVDDAGKKIGKVGTLVDKVGGFFKRHVASIKAWASALLQAHPSLTAVGGALGGVVGGLQGMATALPPLVSGLIVAAPAIVALTGAIGALAASLSAAVGGGVLLGGGLLGSFAVGLGSIAAVAKPAFTALTKYQTAVKALNTAIASGSPSAIKNRQQQLDAIAKANPGIAQLAGNLKAFSSEWKKATEPGRASFFKLAAEGIDTVRKLIPTLATETNKNTAALQSSFQKILAPFLDSATFKGFVSGLGGIFRANLPGFMTGIVNVFKGLASILKVLTPQLDKAGPSFAKFTGNFAKWASSAGGKSTIKEMGRAFSAWLDLVKQIARVIGQVIGAGMKPGTSEVGKWADKLSAFADRLKKPAGQNSLASFFQRSLDDVNKLWPVLQNLVGTLKDIYTIFKPLGSTAAFVLKNMPAPVIAALTAAFVVGKGALGAVGAAKGVKGAIDLFAKTKGDTPLNPLWVAVTGGAGGGPGGLLTKGGAAAGEGATAEEVAGGGLLAAGATSVLIPFSAAIATAVLIKLGMDAAGKNKVRAYVDKQGVVQYTGGKGDQTVRVKANPYALYGEPGYVANPSAHAAAARAGGGDPALNSFISKVQAGLSPATAAKQGVDAILKQADRLKAGMISTSKQTREGALAEWKQFSKDAIGYAVTTKNGMLLNAIENKQGNDKQYSDLRDRVLGHLQKIPLDAKASTDDTQKQLVGQTGINLLQSVGIFGNFAANVQSSVKSGALNTQEAADKIGSAVNRQLQAFGQKPIPGLVSAAATAAWQDWWKGQHSTAAAGLGAHARGGLVQVGSPGERGPDTIPMSVGGTNITVGAGEQVMVLNHQQQQAMNQRWSDHGGLGGFFNHYNKPHYAAKGGFIPNASFAGGGVVDEVNTFFSGQGYDKVAIAGILGNAWQESSGNPNAPGGGMWQQISNFGQGTGGTLLNQMQMMSSQIGGLKSALNAAASPGAAATIFEQGFEKAGIPALANRISFANAAFAGQLGSAITGGAGGVGGGTIPLLPPIKIPGQPGTMLTLVQSSADKMIAGGNAYINAHQPAPTGGGGGIGPVFAPATGPVPAQVQWAQQAAQHIAQYHPAYGHMGAGWGLPAYDCSSYVSTVMDAAGIWPKWTYYTAAGPINAHTDPGPGKYITIGTWGSSGQSAHTMMEINGQFFESGGHGGGPHVDSGWSQTFDQYRHPHGFAGGGIVGEPGYQPTTAQAAILGGPDSPKKRALIAALNSGRGMSRGGGVPWLARGADFVANRPTVIGVGDSPGGERVTVTPRGQGGLGNQALNVTIHKIEVNRKGDVQKIVDEELRLLAASIERHV